MNVTQLLSPDIMYALGWALIHSLWQGAIIAMLLVLAFLTFRKASAQFRYRLSISSLVFVFILFVGTFLTIFQAQSLTSKENFFFTDNEEVIELVINNNISVSAEETSFLVVYADYFNTHLPVIVTLWLLGMVIFTLRFLGGLAYTQRLRYHHNTPMSFEMEEVLNEIKINLGIKQKVQLVESSLINVPMVIGYLKPLILMPLGIANCLSINEIEAILAHELAHIKRYDYLVNIIQSIIETILFFHPAVWWISGEIRRERENCCDDLALQITDSLTLAKALANLEQFKINFINQRKPQLSMAAIGKKNQLLNRIRRVLNQPQHNQNSLRGLFAACILVVCFVATSLDAQEIEIPEVPNETSTPLMEFSEVVVPISEEEIFPLTHEKEENIVIENPVFPTELSSDTKFIVEPKPQTPSFPWVEKKNIFIIPKMISNDKTQVTVKAFPSNELQSTNKIIRISIKKDTSINGKISELTIVRTVKDKNGNDAELKIEIKTKKGTTQTVTVFENDKQLNKDEQQHYQQYIDESLAVGTERSVWVDREERIVALEIREEKRAIAKEKANISKMKQEELSKHHKKIAEERRAIAEERMRLAREKTKNTKNSSTAEVTITREYNENLAELKKEQARIAKELAAQNANLAKENSERVKALKAEQKRIVKAMVIEQTEALKEVKAAMKALEIEQLTEEVNTLWIMPFREALIDDGIIKKGDKKFTIKMDEKGIKVNGKKLSPEQEKKYIKLYESLSGNTWTNENAIHIKQNEN